MEKSITFRRCSIRWVCICASAMASGVLQEAGAQQGLNTVEGQTFAQLGDLPIMKWVNLLVVQLDWLLMLQIKDSRPQKKQEITAWSLLKV